MKSDRCLRHGKLLLCKEKRAIAVDEMCPVIVSENAPKYEKIHLRIAPLTKCYHFRATICYSVRTDCGKVVRVRPDGSSGCCLAVKVKPRCHEMGCVMESDTVVTCGGCGLSLDESADLLLEQRPACPACGSSARSFHKTIRVTEEARAGEGYKVREQGQQRPFIEGYDRPSLSRKTGRWMRKEMRVDRRNNLYQDRVTDPETGEIVHEEDEPLTDHRGHGSAKRTAD